MSNYFRVSREVFFHYLFEGDKFSKREAWIWLIGAATWKPKTKSLRGKTITLERGQLSASFRYLAEIWGWNLNVVQRFLNRLIADGMVCVDNETGTMVITICNYDKYQLDEDSESTAEAVESGRHEYDERMPNKHIIRESKNHKNKNLGQKSFFDAGSEPQSQPDSEREWSEFWTIYPHKVAKATAKKSFMAARKKVLFADLMDGLRRYIASKPSDREWCHAATWLNGERWADQPSERPRPAPLRDTTEDEIYASIRRGTIY